VQGAETRDKSMRKTILFVLIPPPSPKNRRFLGLGGGILFKNGANITHGPGVYTPRYQMPRLRGLGDIGGMACGPLNGAAS